MRGNPPPPTSRKATARSIPACAGEPRRWRTPSGWDWVYPRVCGGTAAGAARQLGRTGLSPRVRGNPARRNCPPARRRSIPACAGEPGGRWPAPRASTVYPRVCGGTLAAARARRAALGSIPACAGEPRHRRMPRTRRQVYPRVCGGTRGGQKAVAAGNGLSPRVRGNLRIGQVIATVPGSIPACAGEPHAGSRLGGQCRVYPRVCGGTATGLMFSRFMRGLSPRVRGNRGGQFRRRRRAGSIPACAGEPPPAPSRRTGEWVYPRVCGGTKRRRE